MNAYELADYVADNGYIGTGTTHEVAIMLRQQADRIAELEKELSWWRTNFKLPTERNSPKPNWLYAPQTKPLSDEEIDDIWAGCSTGDDVIDMHQFARAIEERHGIK